ncbi:MAG: septum formation initiator family protein [Bacteroidales bacterium]|nr:septum formation initiator family protein [Bacteroidales bacterium]MDY4481454.1 septum formation initiator family protein [Candidatus Cryptobacteroides sp.]MDY4562658.1 septum formation initiator family protein [Candidatus Cryptobacteroides sp.]MDY4917666.1 septum formation initiator family protein [Candidatus Cryptobacteroides sp.]MDY6171048.1 septum formation initiator family protein [Candidatus Cryptobacteroides sp.]
MGKIKDIMTGKYGSLIRFSLACLAIFLILWLLGPGNTFISWIQASAEISAMEKQIEDYKAQTKALDARIEDLTTNRDSLEKFARENFHFAAPGEDVYIIE